MVKLEPPLELHDRNVIREYFELLEAKKGGKVEKLKYFFSYSKNLFRTIYLRNFLEGGNFIGKFSSKFQAHIKFASFLSCL